MVTVQSLGRRGGLGTQLFQIAAALGVSRDAGAPLALPPWKYAPHFRLSGCFGPVPPPAAVWQERSRAFRPIEYRPGLDLDGLFQSEKYFARHADHVRAVLSPRRLPPVWKGVWSLHVRRGDFRWRKEKQPLLGLDYFRAALEQAGDAPVLVFSDDPRWVRKVFRGPRFVLADRQADWADFASMAACEHHIVSDSAFSWWSAWIGSGPGRRVLAPEPAAWFADPEIDTSDLVPAGWTCLPAPSRRPQRRIPPQPDPVPPPPEGAPARPARPRPRILYAALACAARRDRALAVCETWARRLPPGDRLVFAGDAALAEGLPLPVWPCVEPGGPEDSYEALPYKTLALLRFARQDPDWDFLFKCDDDTWVFPDRLSELLREYEPDAPLFGGACAYRWKLGNEYSGTAFTMYVGGPGYVLSRPALERAWPQLEAELQRTGLEDAVVASAVWRAGIDATELPLRGTHRRPVAPEFLRPVTTLHFMEPADLRQLDALVEQGALPPFSVLGARTGWGDVGLGGELGFGGARVRVDGEAQARAIGAHARSALLLCAQPRSMLELQGALNDSAFRTASARFEVRTHGGELLAEPGEARRGQPTPPVLVRVPADGRLRLLADSGDTRGCHTVWLWNPA